MFGNLTIIQDWGVDGLSTTRISTNLLPYKRNSFSFLSRNFPGGSPKYKCVFFKLSTGPVHFGGLEQRRKMAGDDDISAMLAITRHFSSLDVSSVTAWACSPERLSLEDIDHMMKSINQRFSSLSLYKVGPLNAISLK